MGTINNFEELEIWQLARELVRLVYADFGICRDFTFKDQITRASISVMNNISEGFCRKSDREFRQFLNISRGSVGEIKCMYYIAEDLKYIEPDIANDRRARCHRILKATSSLMKYLK